MFFVLSKRYRNIKASFLDNVKLKKVFSFLISHSSFLIFNCRCIIFSEFFAIVI